MTFTLTSDLRLTTDTCAVCGIHFAAPADWLQKRRDDGGPFYCPSGHQLVYRKTEVAKLRDRIERLTEANDQLEAERAASERSNAALRGSNTKLRRKIQGAT